MAASNEISIASSNFNGNEIVATWMDWREGPADPTVEEQVIGIGIATSLDGGDSWTDSLLLPPGSWDGDLEFDPMTAYDDRTGTLWAGGIAQFGTGPNAQRAIYVARKDSGQGTFGASVVAFSAQAGLIDKGWMAAGPRPGNPNATNVYIAFGKAFLVSIDMGENWTFSGFWNEAGILHLPRVGPNGEVYVTYLADDPVPSTYRMVRSLDGGQSFDPPGTVVERADSWNWGQDVQGSRFPGQFRVPTVNAFAVDQLNGVLYFVYFDKTNVVNGNVNIDLYLAKSFDQGANWTMPVIINGDPDPPGDQFFSWLEIDPRGNLHLVFLDSSNTVQDDQLEHGMLDAYYSFSDDGGDTWQEFRLTPNSFDSFDDALGWPTQFLGDYIGLARGGCSVYPSYPSSQNGDPDIFSHEIEVQAACCIERRPGVASCLDATRSVCDEAGGQFFCSKTCATAFCPTTRGPVLEP